MERLEDIMYEIIQTTLPPSENCAPMPIPKNPPDGNAEARALAALAAVLACSAEDTGSPPAGETAAHPSPQETLGYISRRRLFELAVSLGEAPLHTQAPFNRGLRLVGDLASDSAQPSAPIYLNLDQHLRLPLDNSSNSLEIQRRLGENWPSTGLRAVKDGMGGIEVDITSLERLAGPLSSELRRALTLDSRPLRRQRRPQNLHRDEFTVALPQRRDKGRDRNPPVPRWQEVTEETMVQPTIQIAHEDYGSSGRYVVTLPGVEGEAELTWHSGGPGIIIADHTYAPDAMRGSGAAAAMVQRLVADARARGVLIVPACSYVRAQFQRHPDWSELCTDT